jgi:hypothetical protein
MNIDRTNASVPLRGPQAAVPRLDMTVSDAGIAPTTASPSPPVQPGQSVKAASVAAQITSSRVLQSILSSAETAALQESFGNLAGPEPAASPQAAGQGLYAHNGNRSRNPVGSQLGGLLDISG